MPSWTTHGESQAVPQAWQSSRGKSEDWPCVLRPLGHKRSLAPTSSPLAIGQINGPLVLEDSVLEVNIFGFIGMALFNQSLDKQ